jgi:superoxide dismutase, Fe-Mn family
MLTRRDLLRSATAGAAALAVPAVPFLRAAEEKKGFTLPKLPYAFDALEPHIDAKTMEIHHDRHHQAYVTNLNTALSNEPEWLGKSIVEVVRDYKKLPPNLQTPVRNNGGGHLNHTWFWQMMKKDGGAPKGELAKAIDASFKTFDDFKKEFVKQALAQFGSGWAWLVRGKDNLLAIMKTANQDNPVTDGQTVLLGCDVWEHAYYLKYQNKRADYVNAWFSVVNWDFVADLYSKK